MPVIQVATELTVDKLLEAVAQLRSDEWIRFEHGWKALHQQRQRSLAEEMESLAVAQRMSAARRRRLSELLDKNKEGTLRSEEEQELDAFMEDIDRRTLQLTAQVEALAHQRAGRRKEVECLNG
jgi:uncharacterized protein YhaN